MEYVFGMDHNNEILRTKGDAHTFLSGHHEIVQEYPDQIITDCFHVVRRYRITEDEEGNCYDWYIIDRHYRYTDKTGPVRNELDSVMAAMFPNENGDTASQPYTKGKYFYHNGDFCKAKTNIAKGMAFTLNTNYTVTTIAAELFSLLNS